LTIFPTAWPSAIVAFLEAFARLTVKVSVGSTGVSPLTCAVTVLAGSPGAKLTVPPAATQSQSAFAVPFAVEKSTVTGAEPAATFWLCPRIKLCVR
jgi:hypothetical protein